MKIRIYKLWGGGRKEEAKTSCSYQGQGCLDQGVLLKFLNPDNVLQFYKKSGRKISPII